MIAQAYAPDWIGPNHIGKRYPLAVWQSTAHVIERREPLNARVTDPVFTPHEQNALSTDGTRSVLVVPLLLGDEALGIMTLFARNDTLFSESEVRVGLKLAAQVSLAIDRARLHDALRQRADTDGLTGVLNHRAILEVLQHEVARSQRSGDPFAVMMIDLDDFKKVNDAHGHQAGDEVLVATAELLRGIIRDVDRIGRYGGDEFLLVMPGVDLDTGSQVAERLVTQIEQHAFQYNGSRMKVGLSIGIAVYPPDGVTDRELVMQADNAMYRHKISRRARAIPEHKLVVSIAPDPITASQAS
jgi:diguanylate cyclase (GGDEF)-like protein